MVAVIFFQIRFVRFIKIDSASQYPEKRIELRQKSTLEEGTMSIYGYVRVSSIDQNEDRQMIAMKEAGVLRRDIFMDKMSGKDFNRQEYKKLVSRVKRQDTIMILSIDRLGRNYEEILEQWRFLTKEKGVNIRVLDMPLLDTGKDCDLMRTFITDLVLQILSFVAEKERENIRERQRQGIEAAKMRGVKFGRPEKPLPDAFNEAYRMWKNKELTVTEAANLCGMSRTTFYNKARARMNIGGK